MPGGKTILRNLVVIKLRYIGDVLLATPMLRTLREAFPEARLTGMVSQGTEEVLRWNHDLDDVLVLPRGSLRLQGAFLRDLRRRRFDCAIDLTDGDRSAISSAITGAPVRIGFNEDHRWRGLLYTDVVRVTRRLHRVERDLEALRPLGLEPKAGPLILHTSPEDDADAAKILKELDSDGQSGRPLVMMQPGARYWFKSWPPERFAELTDRLAQNSGCQVLIGGDAREQTLAERIRGLTRSAPVVLAGRTNLLQYAAILKRCALFVGNDNGPMHMAAALGVPVVALFGPSDPAEWGPRGTRSEVLYKGLDCRPCFHPTCDRGDLSCMKQISVDEAFAAAGRCLSQSRT